jgi:hypothetical protein
MAKRLVFLCLLSLAVPSFSSAHPDAIPKKVRILFLHHSTGQRIWQDGIQNWFKQYNQKHGTDYQITDQIFPKEKPYGWNNYPYDYWNIWVNHAGETPFMEEPTLEMLTKQYDVIVFKHCFPVSSLVPDTGKPDVSSPKKTLENYKAQYEALKKKLHSFPHTKFIVWTPTALLKATSNAGAAQRANEFSDWVKKVGDEKSDNIFVWDFRSLETEGGLFLKPEYATGKDNCHPNPGFSKRVAPIFGQRVVDIIEGREDR